LPNAESGNKLQTKLNRLSEIARRDHKTKFISLAHLLNEEKLIQCYEEIKKDAASGIDKINHEKYGEDLEANLRKVVQKINITAIFILLNFLSQQENRLLDHFHYL